MDSAANDKLSVAWIEVNLNNLFTAVHSRLNAAVLLKLEELAPAGKLPSRDRFCAEMLAAELNLFGFVCNRVNPALTPIVAAMLKGTYFESLREQEKASVKDAFAACGVIAKEHASNPAPGHRMVALAVATRVNILHLSQKVSFLTEYFQKMEAKWEEDYRMAVLDEYDKTNPEQSKRAGDAKEGIRRYLLDRALREIVPKKPK